MPGAPERSHALMESGMYLPDTLQVEATGLGDRDLSYPIPWDISIRSDKEGQSVYGLLWRTWLLFLAPFRGTETLQVTALGRSKASHEFLVLHYFGLDSAMHWDVLMSDVLPAVQLPGASAHQPHHIGNVWSRAHSTVTPQNAPCLVD